MYSLLISCLSSQGVEWSADYDAALRRAKEESKLVVAHFWLEGRPLCRTMRDETFSSPKVGEASRPFVNVRVEISTRPELFQNTVGGRGALATCVLDPDGDVVSVLAGFADPETYARFLEKAQMGYGRLKAAKAAASNAGGVYELAEAYRVLDSPRRAEECYARVIAKEPAGRHAAMSHERLARMFAMRGRNKEAWKHVGEYRRLDPYNRLGRLDGALLTEALAHWLELHPVDALRALEDSEKRFPESPEADQRLFLAGVLRHECRMDQKAMETLELLVKKYPASAWREAAKERIEHIKNPPPGHEH